MYLFWSKCTLLKERKAQSLGKCLAISGKEKPAGSTYSIPLVWKCPHFQQLPLIWGWANLLARCFWFTMSLSLSPHHQGYGKHRNLVQIINTESPGELLAKQGWTTSWPQLFPFEAASGFFFPSIPDSACPLLPFLALFSGSVNPS